MAFLTEEPGDEFSGLAANAVRILKCYSVFPCDVSMPAVFFYIIHSVAFPSYFHLNRLVLRHP
jgi:hypothetical protein